jgi:hypothetical protein
MYYYEGDFVDGYKVYLLYHIFSMGLEDYMSRIVAIIIVCGSLIKKSDTYYIIML